MKNMKNMMKMMNTSWLDEYLIHYFSCALMIDNNYIVDYSIENQFTIHLCIITLSADNFIKIYKDISYNKEIKQFYVISTTVTSADKVVLQCYYWINQDELHFLCKENDPNDIYFNQFWYYVNTSFAGYFIINHINNSKWSIFTLPVQDLSDLMPDDLFNKLMSDYFISSC